MNDVEKLVFVLGDLHGNFDCLNELIDTKIRKNHKARLYAEELRRKGSELEAVFLQCGDFEFFWPCRVGAANIKNDVPFLKDGHVKIYWCAGNHEDHDTLDILFADPMDAGFREVARGVWYARFGATLELAPDIAVLFAGGAESIDIECRVEGLSWWRQEGVSETDLARLEHVKRAAWVISHTAPNAFLLPMFKEDAGFCKSRGMLEEVFVKYRPKRWWFGHYHKRMSGFIDGCKWECLDAARYGKDWYQFVPLNEAQPYIY